MSIYKKLHSLQSEVGAISKEMSNPFFKSKYFDINKLIQHLAPLLQKHNLVLLQPIVDNMVRTTIHDIESGDSVFSEMALPEGVDPQKMGSAVTYLRRYTLQSLLALQADDDDGNAASGKAKPSLSPSHPAWNKVVNAVQQGYTRKEVETKYKVSDANWQLLEKFNAEVS